MTKKEFNEAIARLKKMAEKVSTSKFFAVDLALEELKNIYEQKQRLYKAMKKLDDLTVVKNYNIKDNQNEMVHPVIKEYRAYNKEFLNTLNKTIVIIKDLSNPEEKAENNKLIKFQSQLRGLREG